MERYIICFKRNCVERTQHPEVSSGGSKDNAAPVRTCIENLFGICKSRHALRGGGSYAYRFLELLCKPQICKIFFRTAKTGD